MMVYHTEKQLKEFGEKLPDNVKKPVEEGIAELKKAKESDDIEKMKTTMKDIEEHLMKFGEEIYRQSGGTGQPGAGAPGAGPEAGQAESEPNESEPKSSKKKSSGKDENVVDAEIVDDDK
jgi:molecular chaperone DnaK